MISVLYFGGYMKQSQILQKQMIPQRRSPLADQFVLGGLPLRPSGQVSPSNVSDDRLAFLMRLRVPLLLLGVVGALGLLAHTRPWFAKLSSFIIWPDWRISATFLGVAGYVIVVLVADWLYIKVMKWLRAYRQKKNPGQANWRCR